MDKKQRIERICSILCRFSYFLLLLFFVPLRLPVLEEDEVELFPVEEELRPLPPEDLLRDVVPDEERPLLPEELLPEFPEELPEPELLLPEPLPPISSSCSEERPRPLLLPEP
jgi:hypothetical protein